MLFGADRIHELPSETTYVGSVPLFNLRIMNEAALPEGLVSVGRNWFTGSMVRSVQLPASVRELEDWAFAECVALGQIMFQPDSALRRVGEGCFFNSGITLISIPKGVEELGAKAFMNCRYLSSVVFEGNQLWKIGAECFAKSGVNTIAVPNGLQEVGRGAFADSSLKAVSLPGTLKRLEDSMFAGCRNL